MNIIKEKSTIKTGASIDKTMSPDSNTMPWIEKYRPKSIKDLTQDASLLELFKNSIKTTNITHFLFYGPPGTGKTSAIHAIGREIFKEYFHERVIEFNASDDRGINAVREKITNNAKKFVGEVYSVDGTKIPAYKIIILDEADSMTDEAQDALRVIIEKYSTVTRFCFICNYISKITDAIKSRCSVVYFKKLNYECMYNKLAEITGYESIELSKELIDTIISVSSGDMRKAIMYLQNIKYVYNFKKSINKPIDSMTVAELKLLSQVGLRKKIDPNINIKDIYDIAACIDSTQSDKIIQRTLKCKSILEISKLCREIIAIGYPVDNILQKLNQSIISDPNLTEIQKARIIKYSGNIILKMKECANEYIQLLDYLSCVHGVKHDYDAYS